MAEPGGGRLDTNRVVFPIQTSSHSKPGGSLGGANELQDGFVAFQWMSFPVPADLAKEAAFDRVVFGGASGIVGYGDGEAKAVGQMLLELVLPGAASGGIAASGVSQNQ